MHTIFGTSSVSTSLITVSYSCGNYFRIRNANWGSATVSYTVTPSGEQGTLTLPSRPQTYPYNETYLQTASTGTVQLSYAGTVIATQANGGGACAAAATQGAWTSVIPWPVVGIHSALLPSGKVISWGRMEISPPEYPVVWDPVADPNATRPQTQYPIANNLFCSGETFLPDGRLAVVGGHYDTNSGRATAFTFDGSTWAPLPTMMTGRWYPTGTTMSDGEMLVESGTDSLLQNDSVPEVLQTNGTWRALTTARRFPGLYPWNFAAPNGQIFSAGQTAVSQYINTTGTGSLGPNIPHYINTTRDYGSAVMYDVGKIVVMGGGYTQRSAEIINLNAAVPQWVSTGWMTYPRRQMTATILADGQVLATGGGSGDFRGSVNPVLIPEEWNGSTGRFTPMAPMHLARLYHSSALLLPDGRLLSLGSGQPAATGQVDQYNIEIFSPTYLFNPDGTPATASRPIVTYAPSTVGYGARFTVWTQNVVPTKVLWIRTGATTHSFNENQRLNYLNFVANPSPAGSASTPVSVTAPANASLAPPGHYVLFVLNAAGVPSVGQIIQIH
ncbi:MAG TPA: galactose oxidase-like domain-containing protein [Gemmatimonadaceae bacterium]|nr:galactose oxidase-like domain-containing protein [Gemmatimonadaceae bacterium]